MVSTHPSRYRLTRGAFTAAGLALTAIGFANYFIPGMPSTVCFIIAVWCFKRGNPKFEAWLLNHPWFGATLRDFEENGWITKRVKLISLGLMWPFVIASMFVIGKPWVQALIIAIAGIGTWYILSRPTKPVEA